MIVDPDKVMSRDELIAALPDVARDDAINAARLAALVLLDTVRAMENAAFLATGEKPRKVDKILAHAVPQLVPSLARWNKYSNSQIVEALGKTHGAPLKVAGFIVVTYQEAVAKVACRWITALAMRTNHKDFLKGNCNCELVKLTPKQVASVIEPVFGAEKFEPIYEELDAGMYSEWLATEGKRKRRPPDEGGSSPKATEQDLELIRLSLSRLGKKNATTKQLRGDGIQMKDCRFYDALKQLTELGEYTGYKPRQRNR